VTASYAIMDIETSIFTSFKRKANPFDPRNWVVYGGWSFGGPAQMVRLRQHDQDHSWFLNLLQPSTRFIVGANIKFDILHLMQQRVVREKWMEWVANGGLVWDIQLAEYLLEGQTESSHMLSLDEMAVRYGGDLKVDEVKALWEAGVQTEDIDPDLIKRYLIGEVLPSGERREGDIGNTEKVFKAQLERAKAQGQGRSIILNMGALVASIEMEFNGMYVNRELGDKLAQDLTIKLAEAQQRLAQYLPPDLKFGFSWTNRYHLSPIIFGGTIKYDRRVYKLESGKEIPCDEYDAAVHGPIECPQIDETHYVLDDGSTMEVLWYEHCLGTEWRGAVPESKERVQFKSGKNAGEYKTKKVKVPDRTRPKSAAREFFIQLPGYTKPLDGMVAGDTGLYSVDSDTIERLGNSNIPFLKDLASVKKMDKDLGTYFIRYDEKKGTHVGMLTLVQPDSIIHHSINHTSTVTGRFSSSNPNLQNIPKGNKSEVKTVFESRFGDDGLIGQSDFSSLEVYVQAILTGCVNLISDLKSGIDLHCMRLSIKEKMDYQEVKNLCKGFTDANGVYHEAVSEWDYKRTGAKVFSFQRAYGAGAAAIAESTGMPIQEVEALVAAEKERYPETETYFERRAEEISKNRIPTNHIVPHPKMPAVMCQLGISRVCTPDGKRYTYKEAPAPEFLVKRGIRANFVPTQIKNYEVQGAGAEVMKAAMWLAVRMFYLRKNFGELAKLVNTVHDAQYIDTHKSVSVEAAATLHACMLAASDFIEWWFNWKLPLPVPSDTVLGANMGEESNVTDPNFKPRYEAIRIEIRNRFMNGYTPSFI